MLKRRREWIRKLCSRFLQDNETCMYVLYCPVDSARTQWEKAVEELEDTLVTLRTNPSTITV